MGMWLFVLALVCYLTMLLATCLLFYRNCSTQVVRVLLTQPNIWVLLALTVLYLPADLIRSSNESIPFALTLSIGVIGFIGTDALRVTNTTAVAWLGLIGIASMIGPLVDYTVSRRGSDVIFINHSAIQVTKNDVLTTISLNFVLFFAEGVVAAVRYRKAARRCVFVRALVPRGTVLFTQIHTPNALALMPGVYTEFQETPGFR
eukprot:c46956_g1_i1.p1 GENE.c46956_g1_i1~~c46956_g1_i1.p1  ORF type:complete len:204 (+),score=39.68 c46956_g1_i1:2-613(+)